MKYNEAQQKERMANGLSSIAFGIDVLILIALAKFVPIVGGILALGWFVLICVGAKAHYDHVKSLADAPSEAARVFDSSRDTDFETLGKDGQESKAAAWMKNTSKENDDLMAADLKR